MSRMSATGVFVVSKNRTLAKWFYGRGLHWLSREEAQVRALGFKAKRKDKGLLVVREILFQE